MAVTLPSDLVADVMMAADPARLARATARLSGDSPAAAPTFDRMVAKLDQSRTHDDTRANPGAPGALAGLEQFVVKSFIETILPDEESGTFGNGPSAGVWRSVMADGLAQSYVAGGGLGLAEHFSTQQVDGGRTMEVASGWPYFARSRIQSFAG